MITFTLVEVFDDRFIRHILATRKGRSVIVGYVYFVNYPDELQTDSFYYVDALDYPTEMPVRRFKNPEDALEWFGDVFTTIVKEKVFS